MVEPKKNTLARDQILAFVERRLMGPSVYEEENPEDRIRLEDDLPDRLAMGVLYPFRLEDSESEENLHRIQGESDNYRPSAFGLSFMTAGSDQAPELEISLEAAVYEFPEVSGEQNQSKPEFWTRSILSTRHDNALQVRKPDSENEIKRTVLENRAELFVRWEKKDRNWLVTVAVFNSKELKKRTNITEDSLARVRIHVALKGATLIETGIENRIDRLDSDRLEDRIRYRSKKVMGVGHNCAVEWDPGEEISEIWTEHFPRVVVPDMKFDLDDETSESEKSRKAEFLATGSKSVINAALKEFLGGYLDWIQQSLDRMDSVVAEVQEAEDQADISRVRECCKKIVSRHEIAASRISRSIDLISSESADSAVFEAFQKANQAILDAFRKDKGDESDFSWRPFQLAFLLLVAGDLVDPSSDTREQVDLLWFPTGGGKTEAYLGLTAFEIFRRRLCDDGRGLSGGGVCVIKKYTLRALTFQQFARSGKLISACELIRKSDPERYGTDRITVGIWVGKKNSPNAINNKDDGSDQIFDKCSEGAVPFPGAFQKCPWCKSDYKKNRHRDVYQSTAGGTVVVKCLNEACEFSAEEGIPIEFVDESLYGNPPSLLIGTADKFAQLPLEFKTRKLIGAGRNQPPSMFIQDELHLIDGPLGSVAGMYEAAIDVICQGIGTDQGRPRPKVVGATATISGATEQCRALYGRGQNSFPPVGLEDSNSYFMQADPESVGRLYAGMMGAGMSPLNTNINLTAATLAAVSGLKSDSQNDVDGYTDLISYHNTVRELGGTIAASHDDIPKHMARMGCRSDLVRQELSGDTLSSEVARILEDLATGSSQSEGDKLSLTACTNIFGVGVDIPRLGLMTVIGKPKTNAEYIQATSRIGRGDYPGLALVAFSATKLRDRSHYESFFGNHRALYRTIEPVSVTPFSIQSRTRTLPAAFTACVRLLLHEENSKHEASLCFRDNDEKSKMLEELKSRFLSRCEQSLADYENISEVESSLEEFIEKWKSLARLGSGENLKFFDWKIDHSYRYVLASRESYLVLQKENKIPGDYICAKTLINFRSVDDTVEIIPEVE